MKTQNNKPKAPKTFHALDTRKIAIVDLGQHTSIHSAMARRNSEARNFGRILNEGEMKKIRAELEKYVLAGAYFYLNGDNALVYMGQFANDSDAKQHALTKLFGITKHMVAEGTRLRKAFDNIQLPKAA